MTFHGLRNPSRGRRTLLSPTELRYLFRPKKPTIEVVKSQNSGASFLSFIFKIDDSFESEETTNLQKTRNHILIEIVRILYTYIYLSWRYCTP